MDRDLATGPLDGVAVDAVVQPLAGEIMSGPDMHERTSESLKQLVTATETQVSPTLSDDEVTVSQTRGTVVESTTDNPLLSITTTQLLTTGLKEQHTEGSNDTSALASGTDDKQDTAAKESITTKAPTTTVNEVFLPATTLRRRLEDTKDLIVCPGVYDGFSARIALSIGFDALYMTGAGTTASRLGQPDLGLAQLSDMRAHADMIANLDPYGTPVIADMDTGYGGPNTIALAVQQYIRANVAGFHIEDQVLTKRCGHLSGKKVVSAPIYFSRIRAAKAAKDRAHSDIVLIARTDANQQLGYDECIARLRVARSLGADVGLLEGFKSKEEAARAVKDLAPWPLLLNIVENGHSPLITVDEAREMGFRIMIFSFAGLAPAFGAIKGAYEKLKNEGVTGVQGSGVTPRKIFDVCGLSQCMRVDEEAGGEDFKDGI